MGVSRFLKINHIAFRREPSIKKHPQHLLLNNVVTSLPLSRFDDGRTIILAGTERRINAVSILSQPCHVVESILIRLFLRRLAVRLMHQLLYYGFSIQVYIYLDANKRDRAKLFTVSSH